MNAIQYLTIGCVMFMVGCTLVWTCEAYRKKDLVNVVYWPFMGIMFGYLGLECAANPETANTWCRILGIAWALLGACYLYLRHRARKALATSPFAYVVHVQTLTYLVSTRQPWYRRGIFRDDVADARDAFDWAVAARESSPPTRELKPGMSLTEYHAICSEDEAWGQPQEA